MADISWLTPSNGATFAAGETIPIKWKTSRRTVSPSFRLCLSSELTSPKTRRNQNATASNECGMAIWPVVNEEKGTYCTSLSAPSRVKSHHTYVLRMEDDSGSISESPCFSLIPSRSSTLVADTDNDPSFEAPQAPFVAHMKSSSPPPHISTAHASGGTPNPTAGPSSASSRLPPSHTGSTSSTSSPSYPVLEVLLGHDPSNAAALAVPLAIVASVLLIAILLAAWLRRRLTKRRATDAEKLTLSRQSSKSIFKTSGEPEDGMTYPPGDAPIPLFMPVDLPRVQRRSQRKGVPISATYTNGRPVVRNSVKHSRVLSTRSTHAQANAYLPPTPRRLSDEEHEDPIAHLVVGDYFQPPPPISLPPHERPPRAHVPD